MSVDANGFGPGAPYLMDSTEKLPPGVMWVKLQCPQCGRSELIEILRSKGGRFITGLRFTPCETTPLPTPPVD